MKTKMIVEIVAIAMILAVLVMGASALLTAILEDAPTSIDQPAPDLPTVERPPEPPAQMTGETKVLPEIALTIEPRTTEVEGKVPDTRTTDVEGVR